ncbi:MAG: cob(I)yrinic acid a,c-diamide adenosyltransferase [Chloroflexi bacterium]|nr:cob(I)yrinic acid a,c-diamide adenosyltransferase [Chloroflexota bacterium]
MKRKIYTRTGDQGQTALFAGGKVAKDNVRVAAYGAVDELNAALGSALAFQPSTGTARRLTWVQNQLFVLGSDLATPAAARSPFITRLPKDAITWLEEDIDAMDADLLPLTNFILPGGTAAAAALHQARTIARRAEREIVTLAQREAASDAPLNDAILPYINRLSDWLFVLARWENGQQGVSETIWKAETNAR